MKNLFLFILLPIFIFGQFPTWNSTKIPTLNWFQPFAIQPSAASGMGANTVRFFPVNIPYNLDVDSCAIEVTTLAASAVCKVGIYNYDGTLIAKSANLDAGSTGRKTAAIDLNLKPGTYWYAFVSSSATVQVTAINSGGYRTIFGNKGYLSVASGLSGGDLPSTLDISSATNANVYAPFSLFWK